MVTEASSPSLGLGALPFLPTRIGGSETVDQRESGNRAGAREARRRLALDARIEGHRRRQVPEDLRRERGGGKIRVVAAAEIRTAVFAEDGCRTDVPEQQSSQPRGCIVLAPLRDEFRLPPGGAAGHLPIHLGPGQGRLAEAWPRGAGPGEAGECVLFLLDRT